MRGGALKDALVLQVCLFARFVKDLTKCSYYITVFGRWEEFISHVLSTDHGADLLQALVHILVHKPSLDSQPH